MKTAPEICMTGTKVKQGAKGALRNSKPHFVKKMENFVNKLNLRQRNLVNEIFFEKPEKNFVNEVRKFRQRTATFADKLSSRASRNRPLMNSKI
uniref:Uncharacterized protein n=1 Tax=Romanomermis culicivorax TaxID=13658 RepID=A0A915K0U2_ROMCU